MFGLFALLPCKFFVSRGLQSKRHCAMRLRCLFSCMYIRLKPTYMHAVQTALCHAPWLPVFGIHVRFTPGLD